MIVQAPDEVLSEKASEVKIINSSVKKVIGDMRHAFANVKGIIAVGLAAPQIGVSLRIFIMKASEKSPIEVVINPKTLWVAPNKIVFERKNKKGEKRKLEGCLSLKDIWGTVQRSPKIKISYLDEHGKEYQKMFSGFKAIIVQHEMDHLDGILFPKRVLEQKGKLYQSHKDKEGHDVFDQIEV